MSQLSLWGARDDAISDFRNDKDVRLELIQPTTLLLISKEDPPGGLAIYKSHRRM